jgi:hypothetical protein
MLLDMVSLLRCSKSCSGCQLLPKCIRVLLLETIRLLSELARLHRCSWS